MSDLTAWSAAELELVDSADELHIAPRRADGSLRRPLPIWAVCAGGQVYVRTWQRRETGWYGAVLVSGRAAVHVPGLEADVVVEDVGDGPPELRAGVDAAYRSKYGRYGSSSVDPMVADGAAATTLRLSREFGTPGPAV